MARYTYETLSAQDNSFLLAETPNTHMHVAGVQIYRSGRLRKDDGGIDFDTFKRATEAVLHLIPRYRQRLKWIPLESQPVWVDDRNFNLDYHIRHTALPRPGVDEQLKHLAARIMSQPLDRARPLWEMWVVEGLDNDRFAVISKIHHCMIDGMAGADLAQILMSITPEQEIQDAVPYVPRPAPSSGELLRDTWSSRVTAPLRIVNGIRQFAGFAEENASSAWEEVGTRAQAVSELVGWAVRPSSETPMNGKLGPHRRFDWLQTPLAHVKATAKALGCSVNDLVLTTVSGAVREFLLHRRVRPEDIDFRISAPVSVRRADEQGQMGNRVSSWIIQLPIGEKDPLQRLEQIHKITQELKESRQALGVETMMKVAEYTPAVLLSLGARAASGPINMIVTNVPGPQIPLYMLGAELEGLYPVVPLLEETGLGVALFSYNGQLCWGFNGDYELLPDMRTFVHAVESSFQDLARAAGVDLDRIVQPPPATPVIDLRSNQDGPADRPSLSAGDAGRLAEPTRPRS